MEPTEQNLRAWEEAHRRRSAAPAERPGLPAELAALGAVATGVDDYAQALEAARSRWPSILWVEAPPEVLPAELRRGRFDLVYAGGGVVAELRDPDAFAAGVVAADAFDRNNVVEHAVA